VNFRDTLLKCSDAGTAFKFTQNAEMLVTMGLLDCCAKRKVQNQLKKSDQYLTAPVQLG